MITLLLLLALLWQFYLGYSRGLIKQLYLFLSLGIALAVALAHYKPLATKLTFWVPYTQAIEEKTLTYFPQVSIFDMDKVFYSGLAFLSITLAVYLFLRLIAVFLHFFPLEKLDQKPYNLISGGLSVLMTLVFWSMTLTLVATIPFDQVQEYLMSPAIKTLIKLPILSQLLKVWWVG